MAEIDDRAFNAMNEVTASPADTLNQVKWVPTAKDWVKKLHSGGDKYKAGRLKELRSMMEWGRENDDKYWSNLGPQIGGSAKYTEASGRTGTRYPTQQWTPEQEEYRELLHWEGQKNKGKK